MSLLASSAEALIPKEIQSAAVFGVKLYWHSSDAETLKFLSKEIKEKSIRYQTSWDPDCFYRPLISQSCPKSTRPGDLDEISHLSKQVKYETDGFFDIYRLKDGVTKRDFGGIAQAFFLEVLKQKVRKPWFANFAGDIYQSPFYSQLSGPIEIAEPLAPKVRFAKVILKFGGWAVFSEAGGSNPKPDFRQVVLFAEPNFNGGRLDAWATTIVRGGRKYLEKLWANATFTEKWAYLYFGSRGEVICSPNIECQLDLPPSMRTVTVDFRS